jgi:hypothetical protein
MSSDAITMLAAPVAVSAEIPNQAPLLPLLPVPQVVAPPLATVQQGQPTTISGVNLAGFPIVSDLDIFTVTVADTYGALTATGSGVSGSGTTTLTIASTLDQVNSDLATLTDTDSTTPSDTITLNAIASLLGFLPSSANQQTIAVAVNPPASSAAHRACRHHRRPNYAAQRRHFGNLQHRQQRDLGGLPVEPGGIGLGGCGIRQFQQQSRRYRQHAHAQQR